MSVPPFEPDSSLVCDIKASPNHGVRAGDRMPDMIVLHYTGMPEAEGALEWLCSAESKVSSHYYVFEDGRIIQCVPERARAWHAGESFWANETDINSCSIGIEIANGGHDHNYPDFPPRQIAAVTALCRSIVKRREVPAERILAHSDVAPGRKKDPGEKFPWHVLHGSGIGYWIAPVPIVPGPSFTIGDSGDVIASFQHLLAEYGYGVPVAGEFDEATRDVVMAFQRHFRPARVDGVMDSSTLMTLQALFDARAPHPAPETAAHTAPAVTLHPVPEITMAPVPEPEPHPAPETETQPEFETAPHPVSEAEMYPAHETASHAEPEAAHYPAPEPALVDTPQFTVPEAAPRRPRRGAPHTPRDLDEQP